MAVDTRPGRAHGIVDMHTSQIAEPDYVVELSPYIVIPLGSRHIVTGSRSMARIYAYSYTAFVFDTIDNLCKMLKIITDIRALTGCVFYYAVTPSLRSRA